MQVRSLISVLLMLFAVPVFAGCAADISEVIIIPEPRCAVWGEGHDLVLPETVTLSGDTASDHAVSVLAGELHDYWGIDYIIVPENGLIDFRIDPNAADGRPEGYELQVTAGGVEITAADENGAIWGAMTVLQLCSKSAVDLQIHLPEVTVKDYPELAHRSYFIELNGNNDWGGQQMFHWFKRCIRRLNAYYKCNMIGLGEAGSGSFPQKKFPFMQWERALTADQVRELVSLAEYYRVTPYPVVEIFGHAEGMFSLHKGEDHNYGSISRHPDANGVVLEIAEVTSDGAVGNAVCLSHPKTREAVCDIFDSVTELFNDPEFVHIGMDEAFPVGTCCRCKEIAADELFADYLLFCYDELKKRGVDNIMLWPDSLLDSQKFPGGTANSNAQRERHLFGYKYFFNYITHPALEKMPEDMIMAYWEYSGKPERWTALPFLKEKGFPVWGAGWDGTESSYNIGRMLADNRAEGMIATAWTFGYWRGAASPAGAEAAWNPYGNIRKYDREERMHLDMLPPRASEFAGTKAVPAGFNGSVPAKDLLIDIAGEYTVGKVRYLVAPDALLVAAGMDAVMPVNSSARGMAFLQSGFDYGHLRDDKLADMTVYYSDGTTVTEAIVNGMNTDSATAPRPEGLAGKAWDYTSDARTVKVGDTRIQAWEWVNPYPEKEIKEISWSLTDGYSKEKFAIFAASLIL